MKVALVHDYLVDAGGAERIAEVFHQLYPEAPLYTSIFDPKTTFNCFSEMDIHASFLQYIIKSRRHYKWLLPLYPLAFEKFDFSGYDVVLSSSSAWAKGVKTSPEVCHISYCHSLMRFAWSFNQYVKREDFTRFLGKILPLVVAPLRKWDLISSRRVDYFIANSKLTANKIEKSYGRKATVIYPPVRCSDFAVNDSSAKDFFLVVSRLVPYKRIDIVIEAFNRLALPLLVVGEGRDRRSLEEIAGSNIRFAGRASGEELKFYYSNCRAFILPGEEDFGMTSLEAQASGRPVIAYAAGGALESVIEGKTGTFFNEQTPQALMKAVKKFDRLEFDSKMIRKHAEKFDVEVFKKKIKNFVKEKWIEYRQKN
jgi:glycosyltransferase involved in cell wall biosynthesis